jgi:hypothetical protein
LSWLDDASKDLKIEFATYNPSTSYFTFVSLEFEFALGGRISKELKVRGEEWSGEEGG